MTEDELQPSGEVHPVADLFPMMTDEELDDLATDIKANGLLNPIVLDESGQLIDGRNRLAGCARAGVEPRFVRLNGNDPVAFILSSNVARRHLNKGQQAMAVAIANRFLKNRSFQETAKLVGLSKARVVYANTILDYAPDLSESVLSGSVPLNEAYGEARKRKEASQTDEVKFSRLQREDPELAVLVNEERLKLGEAIRILDQRCREEQDYVRTLTQNIDKGFHLLDPGEVDIQERTQTWLKADPSLLAAGTDLSGPRARRIARALLCYAEAKEAMESGEPVQGSD